MILRGETLGVVTDTTSVGQAGMWTDPPGQVWANFVHEVDELVTLIEGEIELSFQGQTLRPHIGEEVFIPAEVRHTVRNIGTTTNRWCFGYKRKD